MTKINPTFTNILLCTLLFLASTPSNAAMYKYITKDGNTLLTGERLKGSGHKLLKIYQIKKSGAYKTSESRVQKNQQ